MKFAVGMIVGDILLNKIGVIVGWNLVTEETKCFDFIERFKALWYYIILCQGDILHLMCEGINRLHHIEILSIMYNIIWIYIFVRVHSPFSLFQLLSTGWKARGLSIATVLATIFPNLK
jgi:hypothetical protein